MHARLLTLLVYGTYLRDIAYASMNALIIYKTIHLSHGDLDCANLGG